jgi:hypothetical protein
MGIGMTATLQDPAKLPGMRERGKLARSTVRTDLPVEITGSGDGNLDRLNVRFQKRTFA